MTKLEHPSNTLMDSGKYKISLNHQINKQQQLIHKQHLEIQKLKNDYRERDNDVTNLRKSKSFLIGQFFIRPIDLTLKCLTSSWSIILLGSGLLRRALLNPSKAVKTFSPQSFKTLLKARRLESTDQILNNYQKKLVADQPINTSSIALQVDYSRPVVLYISPNLPDFDTSSGGKRATRMVELLTINHEVIIFTAGNKPKHHREKLEELGAIVLDHNNHNLISSQVSRLDSIIYAWFYMIHDHGGLMRDFPNAKIIADSVDVHWLREERSIGILETLTIDQVKRNKASELEAYKHVDIIWAVTEEDRHEILKELPSTTVHVVSNIHNIEQQYIPSNQNNLLFIGGFNHYPNISAIQLIASEILPKVLESVPDTTLTIAGAHAPREVINLGQHKSIIYKGYIEEEDLPSLYNNTKIAVAPLLAGAGIKGKICEAIAYGTLVATNSIGNEGINLIHMADGIISDDTETLSQGIISALKDEFDINQMVTSAQNKFLNIVGPEKALTQMNQTLSSEVSICIVTWNRMELLKRCIESIEGNTIYPFYKILIHSNGCTDGTQQYLEAAAKINPNIIPILSKTNEVFVKPNNSMMRMFPGNDAVLVNNDVYVTVGWLTALREAAYSSNKIGITGSKILYPDGKLQEYGSELYEDGTGRNIGKWQNPNDPAYQKLQRVGYVSGCSMYIKHTTIESIGVFDEQFHPCYCEDSDYAYTAWEHNIQTVVTPESIIYHDEGGTSGTDEDSGFKSYQKVNFKKFLTKHKSNLSTIKQTIDHLNGNGKDK